MKLKDRLILPLDTQDLKVVEDLVDNLSDDIEVFKVGLELFTAHGLEAIWTVRRRKKQVFLDLKMMDIPNTVAGAVRAACEHTVRMMTLHTLGGSEMMRAAVAARNEKDPSKRTLLLGVTILTSLDYAKLEELGVIEIALRRLQDEAECHEAYALMPRSEEITSSGSQAVTDLVVRLAKLAQASGLDGVVASPLEIEAIRAACGKDFLIVTPGVRPPWAGKNDQKRVMDPQSAIEAGADMLVVGRPITKDFGREMGTPQNAARAILCYIRQGLETRGDWPPPGGGFSEKIT